MDLPERRKYGGLTEKQVDQIIEAILERIYIQLGKSLVAKFLWLAGSALIALAAWFVGAKGIKFPGAD